MTTLPEPLHTPLRSELDDERWRCTCPLSYAPTAQQEDEKHVDH